MADQMTVEVQDPDTDETFDVDVKYRLDFVYDPYGECDSPNEWDIEIIWVKKDGEYFTPSDYQTETIEEAVCNL